MTTVLGIQPILTATINNSHTILPVVGTVCPRSKSKTATGNTEAIQTTNINVACMVSVSTQIEKQCKGFWIDGPSGIAVLTKVTGNEDILY